MRKAGFWFTLWAQWTAMHMTQMEFANWLYHKGYTLRRDDSGKVVPCKYLPEWWYLLGGGHGSPVDGAEHE